MNSYVEDNNRRLSALKSLFLAAAGGVTATAAFPKAGYDFLAWAALVPILAAVMNKPLKQRLLYGLVAGMAHYMTLMAWVIHAMNVYGYIPIYLCIPILMLFAAYLALYTAAFAGLAPLLWVRPAIGVITLPCAWVGLEYLRSLLFTGFPWGYLGHSQFERPGLIQIADIFGVYGVSYLIVSANAALFLLYLYLTKQRIRDRITTVKTLLSAGLIFIVMLAAATGYGFMRISGVDSDLAALKPVNVCVVQGNIDQAVKWNKEFRDKTIWKYIELSLSAKKMEPDLVVWPETATPFRFSHDHPTYRVLNVVKEVGAGFIIGSPAREKISNTETEYYNSAFLVDDGGNITGRYDKAHLVPFGEYVPLKKYLPFIGKLVAQVGDFTRGEIGSTMTFKDMQIGVLICYEVIFPEISRTAVKNGANLLVNITNDAWYGTTSGPYQHFALSVFRAVENKRYLVRSANTGFSGFIDPVGRIRGKTELLTDTTMNRPVTLYEEKTSYTRYGDWFAFACAVSAIIISITNFIRRKKYATGIKTRS